MTTATILQRGLFGKDYAPCPDCSECEGIVTGKVYEDKDGNPLCADCFEEADLFVCSGCDEVHDRSDAIENPDGEDYCEECVNGSCSYCERCDGLAWDDETSRVVTRNGRWGSRSEETWCESCVDNHTFSCDDCCNTVDDDGSIHLAGGSTICESCYEDSYFTCEGCGEVYHSDECYCTDDGCFCDGCQPENENFHYAGFRNRSGRVTEIGSARCYGIELETDECDGYMDLDGSRAWGAKDDCTCNGKEFYSDILDGDAGLDAVREWADLADRNGWSAYSNSGYHLHIDARQESDDQLYAIAWAYRATQEVWRSFVGRTRRNNTYCRECEWTCADVAEARGQTEFRNWARHGSRYFWCNTNAYNHHSTIEIRLHHGTCDEDEIINWVKAHTRFVDWASTLGYDGVAKKLAGLDDAGKLDVIAREAWQDDELRDYYAEKAERYA